MSSPDAYLSFRVLPPLLLAIAIVAPAAWGQPQGHADARGRVAGRVVSADSVPVAAARVGIIDEATGSMVVKETDAGGRFQAEGLNPSHPYRIVVTRFGYGTATLEKVIPGGNDLTVRLAAASRTERPAPDRKVPDSEPGTGPMFKVAVSLVTLNVSVTDSNGVPVRGLKQSGFSVFEQGRPQEIVQFSEESRPASYVLLLDTSSSMEGAQLREAKRAVRGFVGQTRPGDEIALIAFTDRVQVLQPLTAERTSIDQAIEQLSARGGTALYDALAQGIELMRGARHPRRFIVVFSDGIDADSRRKFSDIERLVEASDVVVFAVGEYLGPERARFMTGNRYYKDPPLEENYNPVWVLRRIAEISGGVSFYPDAGQQLAPIFSRIAGDIRDQYVLAYVPPPPSPEPEFRNVEVRVSGGPPGVVVRTRKGYLSPGTGPVTQKR